LGVNPVGRIFSRLPCTKRERGSQLRSSVLLSEAQSLSFKLAGRPGAPECHMGSAFPLHRNLFSCSWCGCLVPPTPRSRSRSTSSCTRPAHSGEWLAFSSVVSGDGLSGIQSGDELTSLAISHPRAVLGDSGIFHTSTRSAPHPPARGEAASPTSPGFAFSFVFFLPFCMESEIGSHLGNLEPFC